VKIGLLSDTHGWINPAVYEYFADCDEIWHAGDIGNIETADALARFRPFKAVYGNIDGGATRIVYSGNLVFTAGEVKVVMTHIGGPPGRYDRKALELIHLHKPGLFICGHSHIAKVEFDKKENMLYVNPGAAGYSGFHRFMTVIRFSITGDRMHDMELIELGERGRPAT
jgi:uncharacterized protein